MADTNGRKPDSDERIWNVFPDETGEVDQDELVETMLEVKALLRRVGGVARLAARRTAVDPENGIYITESVMVVHSPHLPTVSRRRRRQEEPPPVEVDDAQAEMEDMHTPPEPVAAD